MPFSSEEAAAAFATVSSPDPFEESLEIAEDFLADSLSGSRGAPEASRGLSAERVVVRGHDAPEDEEFLETIIGGDDRQRIRDTETYPWRMICQVEITWPSDSRGFVGTAWLVAPRTLVTAGHCVYDPQYGGWATELKITPGRDGSERPFSSFVSAAYSTTNHWFHNQSEDHDFAAIHLDEDAAAQVAELGHFSVAVLPGRELTGLNVNLSGYPVDKGGRQMWHDAKRITGLTKKRVFYDMDSFGGQSGAPVFAWENPDDAPQVIGIHAYGTGATPRHMDITANSAPRITPDVLAVLREWIAKDTP
ncbi:MAG: trypsin-like peptidase domain-containing protein [Deltaproteobacteria bacterium]|nr:trypsin-like peptidase domain-containing protein [Deltaproteobacteria bacterium]